jgi:hypothetical protein
MVQGELVKKGEGKAWKVWLFKFEDSTLSMHDCADKECKTPIALLKCGGETQPIVRALTNQQAKRINAFSVRADSQTWWLAAPKPKARDTWMLAIEHPRQMLAKPVGKHAAPFSKRGLFAGFGKRTSDKGMDEAAEDKGMDDQDFFNEVRVPHR